MCSGFVFYPLFHFSHLFASSQIVLHLGWFPFDTKKHCISADTFEEHLSRTLHHVGTCDMLFKVLEKFPVIFNFLHGVGQVAKR